MTNDSEEQEGTQALRGPNRYTRIVERIFEERFQPGATVVPFSREDIVGAARALGIKLPKNLGDVLYSFRFRTELPASITSKAPAGQVWILRPAGRGEYTFFATKVAVFGPRAGASVTKVPDSTPGLIDRYAQSDEQALLAKLRYNRLVDVFTGITCYSLQSHLRTTVEDLGQVETDEVYVGLDRSGAHYVLPVQAKGKNDRHNVVQIESDIAMCAEKFPALIAKPVGAQFMEGGIIAMFEFEHGRDGVSVASEQHYRLVRPNELTPEEIELYRSRLQH
ncbi:MAG TPA: endonuclease [Thermoplasmata archaeon]|nr:endonuclease [Thermoplasmata archaeon]